jgi:hemoglobin
MARIYVRLGGAQAFEALVEELDRRILQDLRLRSYFDGVGLERLKHHQRSFLAMAFGGPPGYLGRTVEAAHSRLDVTDEAFDRVLDHLIAALADLGVSRELIREVACTLLPLRHDIVRAAGPPPGLGLSERAAPLGPAGGTGAVAVADRVVAGRPPRVRRCQLAGAASSATNLAATVVKPPTTRR